jgi:hypothetical protein
MFFIIIIIVIIINFIYLLCDSNQKRNQFLMMILEIKLLDYILKNKTSANYKHEK